MEAVGTSATQRPRDGMSGPEGARGDWMLTVQSAGASEPRAAKPVGFGKGRSQGEGEAFLGEVALALDLDESLGFGGTGGGRLSFQVKEKSFGGQERGEAHRRKLENPRTRVSTLRVSTNGCGAWGPLAHLKKKRTSLRTGGHRPAREPLPHLSLVRCTGSQLPARERDAPKQVAPQTEQSSAGDVAAAAAGPPGWHGQSQEADVRGARAAWVPEPAARASAPLTAAAVSAGLRGQYRAP